MSEKAIEKQIVSYLRYIGFYVQAVQSGKLKKAYQSRGGKVRTHWIHLCDEGVPDILACSPIGGRFVGIEVKDGEKELAKWERTKGTDRRSAAQHNQQEYIQNSGGVAITVSSLDDCIAKLSSCNLL